MGRGERGVKRLGYPGRLSPAGWQETAGNCVGLLLSEGCVRKARWGPPWFLEAVFLARENGREKQ